MMSDTSQITKIYLGGSKGEWRKTLTDKFGDIFKFYNPFTDSSNNGIYAFTTDNLTAIDDCDVVLFYINYHRYGGGCVEAGYARAKGKPILLIFDVETERIEPELIAVANIVSTNFEETVKAFEKQIKKLIGVKQ